jgi:hypothetical protein
MLALSGAGFAPAGFAVGTSDGIMARHIVARSPLYG